MNNDPEGLLAAWLIEHAAAQEGGVIHVARSDSRAARLAEAARALDAGVEVLLLPGWDCLPYDRVAPSAGVMGARMLARAALDRSAGGARLVLTSVNAAGQRLPPAASGLELRLGDALTPEQLEALGYVEEEVVEAPGDSAWREGRVDVWPALPEAEPHRIELDEEGRVQALRVFDPASQRSLRDAEAVALPPATEPEGELLSLFDLMPEAAVVLEPEVADLRAQAVTEVSDAFRLRLAAGEVEEDAPPLVEPAARYLDAAAWKAALRGRAVTPLAEAEEEAPFGFLGEEDPEEAFLDAVEAARAAGRRVALAGDGARATVLARRLRGRFGALPEVSGWLALREAAAGTVAWLRRPLVGGFSTAEALVVAAGDVLSPRRAGAGPARLPLPEAFLAPGDAVIHLDHGVAALRGLDCVEGMDCLALEFHGGARKLVPVDELDRIWRYGAAAEAVTLDRLGGGAWEKRRAEAEAALAETATGLVELARARAAKAAPVLRAPRGAFGRFCAGFPHTPTPDQAEAAEAALRDLTRGRPMDRLVCGDVGFGKTEVALRAAAAAALAGVQVAVLAPTTVLARQHLDSFRRRFAPLGIAVGGLSRLTPAAEARQLRAALADGTLKVVVGTQAILSRTTKFAKLGLVVVDEEQRFGARQKQALRDVTQGNQQGGQGGVHVLAMTATPIPRSLQAALVGLQELSVIATAPARRQPIRTAVSTLEDGLLAEALRRERRRGGQSFVVVPRIEDMEGMRARIRAAAPRLSVVEAHGGMAAAAADDAMIRFAEGRADVLLCTAIIETGLDVPRANTMLVCHPERFGLSQLHQLRGRVGRSGVRGAVWLLTDPEHPPPAATMKRLRALEAMDRVGAGFAIAARDLDLRGAGDLLGEEQAGHVRMLGLPLTQHLLDRALREARGEVVEAGAPVVVKLGRPAHIPEDYIDEEALRLELHSRLGDLLRAGDDGALEEFAAELADRFGPPPEEVAALLDQARLRLRCQRLGVLRLEVGPAGVAASFAGEPPPARAPVEARNGRLVLKRDGGDAVEAAWALLDAMGRRDTRAKAA